MDQSEYMKGDIKDITNWNVKPRTKVPCDSPCCDSPNNKDGGERAEREQSRVPVLWPLLTDRRSAHHGVVRSRNSTPSLSSSWLPEELPHSDRDLTLGGSWLGQGWARNPIRANRSYLWESELDSKQEELLFLCVPCSLRKTVYRGREKTDGHSEKGLDDSSKVLRPECRSVPEIQLPSWLVCETPCVASFYLSYFDLGFCIFQPKESWLKQQQRDSI